MRHEFALEEKNDILVGEQSEDNVIEFWVKGIPIEPPIEIQFKMCYFPKVKNGKKTMLLKNGKIICLEVRHFF